MKTLIRTGILFLIIVLFSFTTDSNGLWLTNFETAKKKAKVENRRILISFSGSDWCSNCKRLEKAVFDTSVFQEFAKDNLVLLNADFPMRKNNKLSKEQTSHNEALAEKYNKKGVFPTTLLLDSYGKIVAKIDGKQNDVNLFVDQIKNYLNK